VQKWAAYTLILLAPVPVLPPVPVMPSRQVSIGVIGAAAHSPTPVGPIRPELPPVPSAGVWSNTPDKAPLASANVRSDSEPLSQRQPSVGASLTTLVLVKDEVKKEETTTVKIGADIVNSRKRSHDGIAGTPDAADSAAVASPMPSGRPLEPQAPFTPTNSVPNSMTHGQWGEPKWTNDPVRGQHVDDIGGEAFRKLYQLNERVLGDGGYATVQEAVHKGSGQKVAVKVIDYAKWVIQGNGITRAQLLAELTIHKQLVHPNIVHMHTYFKDKRNIFVVLEMVPGGDLFDFLIGQGGHGVSEDVARRWFAHLLEGVSYCHNMNVVHRDLKPENILLSTSSENALLKIADFGLAKALNGPNVVCRTNCGTPQYMAPEVHALGETSKHLVKSYGKEADLWGLGVILHVMITCTMPFGSDNDSQEIYEDIKEFVDASADPIANNGRLFHGEVWNAVSTAAKTLIAGLLTADVKKRFTIAQASAHPWMKMCSARTQTQQRL